MKVPEFSNTHITPSILCNLRAIEDAHAAYKHLAAFHYEIRISLTLQCAFNLQSHKISSTFIRNIFRRTNVAKRMITRFLLFIKT